MEAWQSGAALAGSRPTQSTTEEPERLHLWPEQRAAAVTVEGARSLTLKFNPASGEVRGAKSVGVPLMRLNDCPNCGAVATTWKNTGGSSSVGLPIVAETMLAELPEFPSPGDEKGDRSEWHCRVGLRADVERGPGGGIVKSRPDEVDLVGLAVLGYE